jgi:cobalt-zinc-cadmium efflux system protein
MSGGSCGHDHASDTPLRAVVAAFAITAVFFLVELIGGWWTGSLALIADAMHMAVDLIALGMTVFAAFMSRRPPDAKRTFGYKRVEVLAALGNGAALWVATGIILREAWSRIVFPMPVAGQEMLVIASLGLICNLTTGAILYRSSRSNINLRGAFLHVVADALGSIGAILAALIIIKTRFYQADALASAIICLGIVVTSYWLLRDSIHILLEGAPAHLDLEEIRAALAEIEGVTEVHDLHLWSLTQGSESMSGHLVVEPGRDTGTILGLGTKMLEERFRLSHVTLQIEK